MTSRVIRSIAALAVVTGLTGCGNTKARDSRSGTATMVDTLAAAYAAAVVNPGMNSFLNRERAAFLRVDLDARGLGDYQLRYLLASEVLSAGETRQAISMMESLILDASLTPERLTWGTKSLYDMLAIGWMRLGEQENCSLNPSASVCLLPLDQDALHRQQEGARKAIGVYETILRRFPDDYGSKWLLNVAYMTLGGYPDRVPPKHLIPGLTARKAAAFPRYLNVAGNVGLADNGLAGGVSIADFNGDGFLDVFKTSWGLNDQVRLFLADGKGGFVDRTKEAGLTGIVGGLNTVHADYDNDGFTDILIVRGAWLADAGAFPMSLLRNRGNGTFEDVTFAAGLGSRHPRNSAGWADFNLDGFVDLFVGNESNAATGGTSRPSELFLNNGDGTFTEVARRVGIQLDDFVKGVVWGDVNNDGLPDLYASVLGGDNRLFLNRGGRSPTDWRFEEVAATAKVREPRMSFPVWFWDYDNDGWEDLLVLSYDIGNGSLHDAVAMEYLGLTPGARVSDIQIRPIDQTRLYHNDGKGAFTDVSAQAGLTGRAIFAMGSNFGDIDNDGWLDFYLGTGNPDLRSIIPNRMFRGVEGKRFEEITFEGGFGHLQKGHAPAFADFDRDGDQDVFSVIGGAFQGDTFTSVLFENPGWPGRNWVTLELEGAARPGRAPKGANRSAIGARVHLVVADSSGATRNLHRTIRTGGSFGSTSLELHVGLGPATQIKELHIRWPDAAGSTATFKNVAVNRAYRVPQGGDIVALDRPAVPFRRAQGPIQDHRHAK